MKIGRIIMSLFVVGGVVALGVAGTRAFFNDTETSTGNTFTAGAIDLKIDNTSYAIDYNIPGFQTPTGAFVANPGNSWTLNDLTLEKFFNFTDLKPGDYGEDTISIHVNTNNSWLCAAARITQDLDNTFSEPEDEVFGTNTDLSDGTADGDLDSGINFAFWKDDGDNVYEVGEPAPFLAGPLSGLNPEGKIALADSQGGPLGPGAILGGTDVYIGKIWCYGTLTPSPIVAGEGTPAVRGTGWNCNGSSVGNIGQTDSVVGDLQFYAVQSRNNSTFTCATNYTPVWPVPVSPEPSVPPVPNP